MAVAEPEGLVGKQVIDANGKPSGQIDFVFAEPANGKTGWIGVRTGAIRRQRVLVPLAGAERRALSVYVPWTKTRLRRAPSYQESDLGGALGLGEYRLTISARKQQEACAYWGIGEGSPG